MTTTEKQIIEAVGELAVAVTDLYHQLSLESNRAVLSGEALDQALLEREENLESCRQTLISAQHRLTVLGASCFQ
jgi:hypothetical protein